jgi:MFS family permease
MRSLWTLFRTEPLLREAGVLGALVFASFSCFWTTLAFLLESHYRMGPGVAGTFGVVGAAGALVAPFAGRLSDRRGTRYVVTAAGAVLTGSYLWLWVSERAHMSVALHMFGMVIGVVALDVGAQMMQVANQTRIFGLGSQVRSRLNTIYMTLYFVGGAVGSALATLAWARWRWDGVCVLELMLIAAAGVRHMTGFSKRHPPPLVRMPVSEREPA